MQCNAMHCNALAKVSQNSEHPSTHTHPIPPKSTLDTETQIWPLWSQHSFLSLLLLSGKAGSSHCLLLLLCQGRDADCVAHRELSPGSLLKHSGHQPLGTLDPCFFPPTGYQCPGVTKYHSHFEMTSRDSQITGL